MFKNQDYNDDDDDDKKINCFEFGMVLFQGTFQSKSCLKYMALMFYQVNNMPEYWS